MSHRDEPPFFAAGSAERLGRFKPVNDLGGDLIAAIREMVVVLEGGDGHLFGARFFQLPVKGQDVLVDRHLAVVPAADEQDLPVGQNRGAGAQVEDRIQSVKSHRHDLLRVAPLAKRTS